MRQRAWETVTASQGGLLEGRQSFGSRGSQPCDVKTSPLPACSCPSCLMVSNPSLNNVLFCSRGGGPQGFSVEAQILLAVSKEKRCILEKVRVYGVPRRTQAPSSPCRQVSMVGLLAEACAHPPSPPSGCIHGLDVVRTTSPRLRWPIHVPSRPQFPSASTWQAW